MNREKIMNMVASQIGTVESPVNSNNVKYNTEYYGKAVNGSAYPWCCSFVWWVFKQCGASSLFYDGKKTAYCPTVQAWAKQKGIWTSTGKRGDLVLFNFHGGTIPEHIGFVENKINDTTYTTIEGNTGSTSQANGGRVERKTRYTKNIVGFVSIQYETEKTTKLITINDIVWELNHKGIVSDKNFWLSVLNQDKDVYYLAQKMVNTPNKHQVQLISINDIVWELNNRGIMTNKELWLTKLSTNENLVWLCRKFLLS